MCYFFYLAENYVLNREVCNDFGNNEIFVCKVFDWKVLVQKSFVSIEGVVIPYA